MDMNGVLNIMNGGEPPVLSNVSAASAGGNAGENKQGVLKFSNGFKIQWQTVDIAADGEATVGLVSAYTERHLGVMACYAETIGNTTNQSSVHIAIPAAPNALSKVAIFQIINSPDPASVTFISWGLDTV